LSSRHEPPFYISYIWRHMANGKGVEGRRTHLLIDLPPGRAITQPIVIEAPINPGDYMLEITPLLEHVTWLSEFRSSSHVTVSANVAPQSFTHKLEEPPPSYFEKHIRGAELLSKWIDVHIGARSPFVLEIGGNYSPATERLHGCVVVNLDVDAHGLMTRNIVKSDSIKSLVADGMDIPFADHSFDVITMFAAFHHFPDPISFLRHLSTKVKPSGLICLMLEPIGHVRVEHDYKEYIDELEKGVYEQSFEIWEYVAMTEAAGLEMVDAVFESGAAMIAARPKR
jgi:SAM-dependent methyltransferase